MQTELRLIGCIKSQRRDLPANYIAACDTEQAAMRLCVRWHRSSMPNEQIAQAIGLKPDVLSKMLNSDHYEKNGKATRAMGRTYGIRLQNECGNNALKQWDDMCEKGLLNCQRSVDQRLKEIESERAELLAQKVSFK